MHLLVHPQLVASRWGKRPSICCSPFVGFLDLLDASEDIPFLSNLIQREIVYRLLRGPQGERLRAIATLGDQSHRTAKAISFQLQGQ